MRPEYVSNQALSHFIKEALAEDIGRGDYSTLAIMSEEVKNQAQLLVKDEGIIAGVELAEYIFKFFDSSVHFEKLINDGSFIKKGDVAFIVEGSAKSILPVERLVLNCMQRMSGIATLTNFMQEKIKHTKTKLLDTRKTTPNFRVCEKWAVKIGGGENHRFGLFDMIMLKDNHVDFAGGIVPAIQRAKEYLKQNKLNLKIEIETRNLKEVKEALTQNPDRIMLDNFNIEQTKEAVDRIGGRVEIESSGGITIENLVSYAETGVDYISSGALTYSARSLDLSLKVI